MISCVICTPPVTTSPSLVSLVATDSASSCCSAAAFAAADCLPRPRLLAGLAGEGGASDCVAVDARVAGTAGGLVTRARLLRCDAEEGGGAGDLLLRGVGAAGEETAPLLLDWPSVCSKSICKSWHQLDESTYRHSRRTSSLANFVRPYSLARVVASATGTLECRTRV